MNDIYNIIDAYTTSALSPEEEQYLFATLATDTEARRYFKERQVLSLALKAAEVPFPDELDEAILSRVQSKHTATIFNGLLQPVYVTAISAAAVLLVMFLFFFNRVESYRSEVDHAMVEINNQKQTIDLLLNGLPTIQVTSQNNNRIHISNN